MVSLKSLIQEHCQLIITDFDETITAEDSLHLVVDAASQHASADGHEVVGLTELIEVYTRAKDLFKKESSNLIDSRLESVSNEIEYQRAVKEVELSSVQAAQRGHVFHGVPKETFARACDKIKTRDGFKSFLSRFYGEIPIVVLSVNWSYAMIAAYFAKLGFPLREGKLELITNDFEFDDDGICTGEIVETQYCAHGIRTGYDKLVITKNLIEERDAQGKTVYIGDSETDVLSMLECGKSISIFRKAHSSYDMLQSFGVKTDAVLQDGSWHHLVHDWNEL